MVDLSTAAAVAAGCAAALAPWLVFG